MRKEEAERMREKRKALDDRLRLFDSHITMIENARLRIDACNDFLVAVRRNEGVPLAITFDVVSGRKIDIPSNDVAIGSVVLIQNYWEAVRQKFAELAAEM